MPQQQRDATREQFWREHLQRQQSSGLSIRGYCQRHGLREPSFYIWRRTIAQRDATPAPPAFVPVRILDTAAPPERASPVVTKSSPSVDAAAPCPIGSDSPIEIHLTGGQRVCVRVGCDRALLASVLAVLEGR